MVLDRHRGILDWFMVPLGRALGHVNPNTVTVLGLVVAVPAAWLFYRADPATEAGDFFLVGASALVLLHGVLDLLDGVIARMHRKETPLGDFLDHVVDRVSDVLLLSAVAFSPWGDVRLGLWAIVATLLTSYLGTQAQAVGAGRMYMGFAARADRLVLLAGAPLADHFLVTTGVTFRFLGVEHVLGLVLWYIAIGGGLTALERFVRIYRYLARRGRGK